MNLGNTVLIIAVVFGAHLGCKKSATTPSGAAPASATPAAAPALPLEPVAALKRLPVDTRVVIVAPRPGRVLGLLRPWLVAALPSWLATLETSAGAELSSADAWAALGLDTEQPAGFAMWYVGGRQRVAFFAQAKDLARCHKAAAEGLVVTASENTVWISNAALAVPSAGLESSGRFAGAQKQLAAGLSAWGWLDLAGVQQARPKWGGLAGTEELTGNLGNMTIALESSAGGHRLVGHHRLAPGAPLRTLFEGHNGPPIAVAALRPLSPLIAGLRVSPPRVKAVLERVEALTGQSLIHNVSQAIQLLGVTVDGLIGALSGEVAFGGLARDDFVLAAGVADTSAMSVLLDRVEASVRSVTITRKDGVFTYAPPGEAPIHLALIDTLLVATTHTETLEHLRKKGPPRIELKRILRELGSTADNPMVYASVDTVLPVLPLRKASVAVSRAPGGLTWTLAVEHEKTLIDLVRWIAR